MNSGERTFDDVLRLVTAGLKFKEWLKKGSQDGDVIKEYCREVTRTQWAEKLPPNAAAVGDIYSSGYGRGLSADAGCGRRRWDRIERR